MKNSRELREKVKDWRLEEDEILVSYDVKNLYPFVPIKKVLQLVERLFKESRTLKDVTELSVDSIMSLLRWMFSLTYCEYNGQNFVLGSGPTGLGTTGEVAIIYMEKFQIQAIKTSPYPLEHWYWYVDDSELKCRTENSERIFEHLNAIEKGVIVFTKEEQHEGSLPVLDLKQNVNRETSEVECMVHYKKIHTNINVKERSNHPHFMKKGIIRGFPERARALCDGKYLNDELQNIKDVFVANGYERNEVKRCLREKVKEKTEETREYRGVANIPYVKGLSEQFKRVAEKHGVRTTFRPGRKLKELRKQSQCPLGDKRKAVVYRIQFGCDEAVYVGETYRQFETRKKEHERKVRLTRQNIEKGRLHSAETRMGKEDGGLASHSIKCEARLTGENQRLLRWKPDTDKGKQEKGLNL